MIPSPSLRRITLRVAPDFLETPHRCRPRIARTLRNDRNAKRKSEKRSSGLTDINCGLRADPRQGDTDFRKGCSTRSAYIAISSERVGNFPELLLMPL